MNTVKSFEFESMRHNVTPSQFLAYVRSRVDAKGGKYVRSDLDLDYFKRGNDLNFDVQHTEECDYLYERSISKPYEMQTYMRYIDGTVYNEICEFTFDDEKTGHGYYYLVCVDPVAESVEENKAESLERIAKRFEDKAEKAAKDAEEIREDLECTDGMMECHVNAMRYEAERYEQVAQENAEKAKKCRKVINSTTGEELAENEKEVNTMTTENTTTTTAAETAETEQEKTTLEELKAQALEMLKSDDDLFVSMVDEMDSWNGYADGFRCFDMSEIDDLFGDMKVSEFLDKLAGGFDHTNDYFVDTIYGIDSTNDKTGLYRENVLESELLDNIIEYANHLWFSDSEFEELINKIMNFDDDENGAD